MSSACEIRKIYRHPQERKNDEKPENFRIPCNSDYWIFTGEWVHKHGIHEHNTGDNTNSTNRLCDSTCNTSSDPDTHSDPDPYLQSSDPDTHSDPDSHLQSSDPDTHSDPDSHLQSSDPDTHSDPDSHLQSSDPDTHSDPDSHLQSSDPDTHPNPDSHLQSSDPSSHLYPISLLKGPSFFIHGKYIPIIFSSSYPICQIISPLSKHE